jgi:hypothetical protein|tara:strand:+ start:736 stop:1626 length:891 start_codon:yes stop_codon:yes gene_type:complete
MNKLLFVFCLCLSLCHLSAQELNCTLVINAEQTGQQNQQIFKTLERSLNDFVNKTTWTNKIISSQERIDCGMIITVTEFNVDRFKASIQVQSSRPVYNSTYSTPIFNFNDTDFNFDYIEFQNLTLNPNQFQSNLTSVISFYTYMILGMDADTFSKKGGTEYYTQAKNILNVAQSSGYKGWAPVDGNQTRYVLLDQLLSPSYVEYRDVLYAYHRTAMDVMSENQKKGKQRIILALNQFKRMNARRANSFLQRTFFDAKSDEIEQIFSGGQSVKITDLVDLLNRVSPNNSSKWKNIKF